MFGWVCTAYLALDLHKPGTWLPSMAAAHGSIDGPVGSDLQAAPLPCADTCGEINTSLARKTVRIGKRDVFNSPQHDSTSDDCIRICPRTNLDGGGIASQHTALTKPACSRPMASIVQFREIHCKASDACLRFNRPGALIGLDFLQKKFLSFFKIGASSKCMANFLRASYGSLMRCLAMTTRSDTTATKGSG